MAVDLRRRLETPAYKVRNRDITKIFFILRFQSHPAVANHEADISRRVLESGSPGVNLFWHTSPKIMAGFEKNFLLPTISEVIEIRWPSVRFSFDFLRCML